MSREVVIEGRIINDGSLPYIIAEVGHNHQGDIEQAKAIFRMAKECGADAVKLQKRDNRALFTKEMYDSSYVSDNAFGSTYGEHREALEMGRDAYIELKKFCKEIGITLFSTAFDFNSADFLADLDMPAYKVASGDLLNIPLIEYIAKIGKPMIMSTGGGEMKDVLRAYNAAIAINPQICILQCTAGYPPKFEEINLKVIETFRREMPEAVIGLSSHDSGISMALISYIMGARVIEKHVTLNRAMKGTDHAFSLEHSGLRKLVRDLERAREALGDGVKKRYDSELKPLFKMGKKLVAARNLPAGTVLSRADIAIKSPNDGVPPYELEKFLGKKLSKAVNEDENLTFEGIAS